MQECPGADALSRWLADALPASQVGPMETHVEACAECQAAVERLLGDVAAKKARAAQLTEHQAEAEFLHWLARQEPSSLTTLPQATAPAEPPPPPIQGYEILEEIGRGGMGIVYRAWQCDLNRPVAIKLVLLGAATSPEILVRFRQEAELAARLQHPNIVAVHEINHQDQRAFLVMEYVEGGTLAARCQHRPQSPLEAARLIEMLARTIDFAHRKGVLHRDLKPSNVLLTPDGTPKIADFGLATCIGLDNGLTATGAVLGTPGYMAPEQARKRERQIGPATDVYGLGAIFYELLTGRQPVTGSDLMDILYRLAEEEPIGPRRLQPTVPRDLEMICLKCLRKDPRHRYTTADALADDLRRFLDGKPIAARPVSTLERAWRWARRNRGLAGTLSAALVLLVVLVVGSTVAAVLFRDERNRAVQAEGQANTLLAEALRSVAGEVRAMRLRGERGAYFRGMPKLRAALAQARELKASEEVIRALRDEMGNLLTVGDVEITREWDDLPAGTEAVSFAPKLDRYARIRIDGVLSVHETGTGKELSRLPVAARPLHSAAVFSPDGTLLYFSTRQNQVACWNVAVPRATRLWGAIGQEVSLSSDGKVALYARVARKGDPPSPGTQVVDARSGKEIRLLPQGQLRGAYPVHPSRPWVALSDGQNLIAVDYLTGKQVGKVPGQQLHVCWHPVAPVIALATRAQGIELWDVLAGRQVVPPLLGHTIGGVTPIFDPTGQYLLSTEWSNILRVWDAATGHLTFQAPLRAPHTSMTIGPDGQAAAAIDGQKLRLLRIYPGQGLRVIEPASRVFSGFTSHFGIGTEPSGRVVAIGRAGYQTALLDAETGRELGTLPGKTEPVACVGGDGSLLAIGDRGPERWPIEVAAGVCRVGPPQRLPIRRWSPGKWGVSADGRVIGVTYDEGGALIWDRERPGEDRAIRKQYDVRQVRVSPDGRWVVAGSHGAGGVSVSDARTGKFVRELIPDGGDAVFSPGGRWLGVWGFHGGVTLFRTGTWERTRLEGDTGVAFSPNDQLVAVGEGYGIIRLVATETGQEVSRLETSDRTRLGPVGFSPDGGRLYAVGEQTRALYIWDLRLIRARLKALDADWDWPEFSPPLPKSGDGTAGPLKVVGVNIEPPADPQKKETALKLNDEAWQLVTGPREQRDPSKLALKLIQEALQLDPDNPTYLNTLGVVQYRNGLYREAVVTLEKSLAAGKGQDDARDLFFLAMCHARLGSPQKAKDCFDRAVKWWDGKNDLPAGRIAELKAFRAEAAAVLGLR
jgi:WD40 repeat protein